MNPIESKALHRLNAALKKELEKLSELVAEHSALPFDATHPRIIGSILHDFYTGVERIFHKIAAELEGDIPQSRTWHKDLLDDMALDIQQVRPAVITDDLRQTLEQYLRFRHVFRGSYGFELDSERMRSMFEELHAVFSQFQHELAQFLSTMTVLAQELGTDDQTSED